MTVLRPRAYFGKRSTNVTIVLYRKTIEH